MAKTTITVDGEEREYPSKKAMIKDAGRMILAGEDHAMTARQLYYRFVALDILENKESQYQYLLESVKEARLDGTIPWDWIEDRTRGQTAGDHNLVSADSRFDHAKGYFEDAPERHVLPRWLHQPEYLEVWVEKEALAAVFERRAEEHGVVSFPCRGYPSITSLKDAADRIKSASAGRGNGRRRATIIYFGDYDPSGQDIERHITETLGGTFGVEVEVERAALNRDQIDEYELPPQPAKKTDARYETFLEEHGDIAVELDAMPPDELRDLIDRRINDHFDDGIYQDRVLPRQRSETEDLRSRVDSALGRSDGE